MVVVCPTTLSCPTAIGSSSASTLDVLASISSSRVAAGKEARQATLDETGDGGEDKESVIIELR